MYDNLRMSASATRVMGMSSVNSPSGCSWEARDTPLFLRVLAPKESYGIDLLLCLSISLLPQEVTCSSVNELSANWESQ
jgi:hypothetical protein